MGFAADVKDNKVVIDGKTRSITEVELRKIALPLDCLTSDHF